MERPRSPLHHARLLVEMRPSAAAKRDDRRRRPMIIGYETPRRTIRLAFGCWSERRDLNSRPPVPQTGALTGLRYAPPKRVRAKLYAGGIARARASGARS